MNKEPAWMKWKAAAAARIAAETEGLDAEQLLAYWQAREARREERHQGWRGEPAHVQWKAEAAARISSETAGMSAAELLEYWKQKEAGRVAPREAPPVLDASGPRTRKVS